VIVDILYLILCIDFQVVGRRSEEDLIKLLLSLVDIESVMAAGEHELRTDDASSTIQRLLPSLYNYTSDCAVGVFKHLLLFYHEGLVNCQAVDLFGSGPTLDVILEVLRHLAGFSHLSELSDH
jgi:hypothetical protein